MAQANSADTVVTPTVFFVILILIGCLAFARMHA